MIFTSIWILTMVIFNDNMEVATLESQNFPVSFIIELPLLKPLARVPMDHYVKGLTQNPLWSISLNWRHFCAIFDIFHAILMECRAIL